MTSRNKQIVAGAGALAALALALLLWPLADRPATTATAPRPPATPKWKAPAAIPNVTSAAPRTDTSLAGRYDLRYELDLRLGAAAGPVPAGVRLQGTVEVAALPARGGARWLALRAPTAQVEAGAIARRLTDLGATGEPAGLRDPWVVRVGEQGQVEEVRFLPATAVAVRALWASLAYASQVVDGRAPGAAAWQAQERDVNSTYRANYLAQAGGRLHKGWEVAPDHPDPARKGPPGLRMTSSADYHFDDKHLQRLHVRQDARVSARPYRAGNLADFGTQIDLTWIGAGAGDWASDLDPSRMVPFEGELPRAAGREPGPRADLAALDAKVREATAAKNVVAVKDLRNGLIDQLRDHGDQVAEVDAKLRAGGMDDAVERVLAEGLVGAGTPVAQAAVAKLIDDRATLREGLLGRMLATASFLQRPDAVYLAAIQRLADDRTRHADANAAAVVWGANARALAEDEPVASQAEVKAILDRAAPAILGKAGKRGGTSHPAPDSHDAARARASWFDAIGNAGAMEGFALVKQGLVDPVENVRLAAAQALRFLDGPAVRPLIIQRLAQEDSIHVRAALIFAARWVGPEYTLQLVTRALQEDVSDLVRLEAAFTIAMWSVDTPALVATLEQAAARERSEDVRGSLLNYIHRSKRHVAPFVLVGTLPGSQP